MKPFEIEKIIQQIEKKNSKANRKKIFKIKSKKNFQNQIEKKI